MTMAPNRRGETLDLLHSSYDALTKAGEESLSKAYVFGNVVNALHGIFSYRQMADELGVRSTTTVSKYAKLYRQYATEALLLEAAKEINCYDVSILSGGPASTAYRYMLHCENCGSFRVKKERETPELKAAQAAEVEALAAQPLTVDA